ncbi:MAG TPA: 6-phosphogluconolactonase [Anaerolineales bacterium]|nr:6-phosphogluconolactonase [Anaerolineales bacterium]HRQ92913.1 6-phosphogluconolactonase [Anaerolineales bacterium]
MQTVIFDTADELAAGAAGFVAARAQQAMAARGRFDVALSGGSTPLSAYTRLAAPPLRDTVDWQNVHIFWSDERCVPPDDAQSNYAAAKAALLNPVAIPQAHIHRMRGELPPYQAAEDYRQQLAEHFHTPAFPVFDLILLGLGTDGHIASLFPGSAALRTGEVPVTENYVSRLESWRLTFTLPLINSARDVAFIVSGVGKAAMVSEVLTPGGRPLPAKAVNPHSGGLTWLLDLDAASVLNT